MLQVTPGIGVMRRLRRESITSTRGSRWRQGRKVIGSYHLRIRQEKAFSSTIIQSRGIEHCKRTQIQRSSEDPEGVYLKCLKSFPDLTKSFSNVIKSFLT
ncbi:hypothetical protein CDL15_Pgr012917 [Punica granatum]|uniref:Uncharacterized protein n=1 Tax=Punica granatum TaxID=22663 RepID=A0A218XFC9_PUNGR|nr:hypothetical protein CDL15_Pgr012917 [Punica granatum]